MQRLVDVCFRRPVFASMLIATLVVIGIAGFMRLGQDRVPAVDLPTVNVRTTLPGASTEEVETLVSQRIEEAVNTIEGIDQLRSISTTGASNVVITFRLDRPFLFILRDVDTGAILFMGIWPKPFIDVMHGSVADLLAHVARSKL